MKELWNKYKWWLAALIPVFGFWLCRKQLAATIESDHTAARSEQRRIRRVAAQKRAQIAADTATRAADARATAAADAAGTDDDVVAKLNTRRKTK